LFDILIFIPIGEGFIVAEVLHVVVDWIVLLVVPIGQFDLGILPVEVGVGLLHGGSDHGGKTVFVVLEFSSPEDVVVLHVLAYVDLVGVPEGLVDVVLGETHVEFGQLWQLIEVELVVQLEFRFAFAEADLVHVHLLLRLWVLLELARFEVIE